MSDSKDQTSRIYIGAGGCEHRFIEKAPVVSTAHLSPGSVFPQAGCMACAVQDEWVDERGRRLVRVDTSSPWDVASVAGETSFTVLRAQVSGD